MKNILTHSELTTLRKLMLQLLNHAQKEEWEELQTLDNQRLDIVRRELPEKQLKDAHQYDCHDDERYENSQEYAELTKQVIQLDKQLVEVATKARDNLLNQGTELRNQNKAKQKYAQANNLNRRVAG